MGDLRYDVAKMRHSYCGLYDYIVEDRYQIVKIASNEYHFDFPSVLDLFDREILFDKLCRQYRYSTQEIKFIEAVQFLTMIPLHADNLNRQISFFLNGIKKLNSVFDKVCQWERLT